MDSAPPFERKKSPELYVQPATTPRSSALCDLSPVCNYLNRNSWMKSDSCRGDDRRSLRNVAPSLPVPYHVKNYFSRNEFRLLHYLIRCGPRPGFLSLKFLSNSATFRKRARPTRRDATRRYDRNGFSCLSTAHDRRSYRVAIHAAGFLTIAWKNFDRCRRMRFIPFLILPGINCYKFDSNRALRISRIIFRH